MRFGKSYDVIVAGLGTAGAIALITAAKRGLKVLGIDPLNAMGGTMTDRHSRSATCRLHAKTVIWTA